MWEAIPVILDEFEKDPAIRVVVVTGAGDKAFVSGADISEFEKARSTPEQVAYYDKIGEVANARLNKCSKPTIARIRGYCIGGGLAVSLLCDIRIASDNASSACRRRGSASAIAPAGLKILMDLVGPSHAKEIFFTARHFSAQEALRHGPGQPRRAGRRARLLRRQLLQADRRERAAHHARRQAHHRGADAARRRARLRPPERRW